MLAKVYYIFTPKKDLLDLTNDLPIEIKELFSNTFMWSKYEGGVTSWGKQEYELEIKCLFLMRLWSDYSKTNSKHIRELLDTLLGKPPFKVNMFDKWWLIERLEEDETLEEVQNSLTSDELNLIEITGNNLVDQSINLLKKNK